MKQKGFLFLIKNPRKFVNNFIQSISKSELLTVRLRVYCHQMRGVEFEDPKSVFIGPDVIFDGSFPIPQILVGKNVYITRGTKIVAHQYDTSKLEHKFLKGKVEIGNNVFIGFNSVIICSKIGDFSVIGANSVITKDIPPYSIVINKHQKIIKDRRY